MEPSELITSLGKKGLLERLSHSEREEGLSNWEVLLNSSKNVYNSIGAIYPLLNVENRKKVVKNTLNEFDGIRYDVVNRDYTPQIREPLLLADIIIQREIYWPGLHDEEKIWKENKSFSKIEKEVMAENGLFKLDKVNSDFLVAYALMRTDFTSFGEDYIKAANPEFLSRVIEGIVNLRVYNLTDKIEIEEGIKRLHETLPKSIHERIVQIYQK
jgi:hypothetical protein